LIYKKNLKDLKRAFSHLKSNSAKDKKKAIANSGGLSANTAFRKAVNTYKKDALQYLIFAKECETYTTNYYYPWDEEPVLPVKEMEEMEKRGIAEMNSLSDPSIRQRYAFQIIRLSHYRNNFHQTVQYFQELKIRKHLPLYYRILSLYAGALSRTGKRDHARYLFGLIALQSEEYGGQAKIDFINIKQSERQFKNTLSFARSQKDKIAIYHIRSMLSRSVSLDDMEAVREMDSMCIALEEMLINQIRIMEENLLNRFYGKMDVYPVVKNEHYSNFIEQIYSYGKKFFSALIHAFGIQSLYADSGTHRYSNWTQMEIESLRNLRKFNSETIRSYSVRNPQLWYLAGAYLSLLDEDFSEAQRYLKKADENRNADLSPYLAYKKKELNLMYSLMSGKKIDAAVRKKYAEILRDLYKNKIQDLWTEEHQPQMYTHRMLKRALWEQNQKPPSLLISDWSGFDLENYNADELTAMLALIEKKNPDSLEIYIVGKSDLTADRVARRLSSQLIKENQLARAIRLMERFPKQPLNRDYIQTENPFRNYGSIVYTTYFENKIWTKRSFAFHMLLLQKKASLEKDPLKKAKLYVEMGNGWYSISHYGSWWIIVDDSWSIMDDEKKYRMLLIRARDLWKKAYELAAHEKELAAECLYMTALAEQRLHVRNAYDFKYEESRTSDAEKEAWKALKKKYSDTDFFKYYVEECYYYRKI